MSDMLEINCITGPEPPPLSVILPVHQASNSLVPFVHALKLAYSSKGELEIIDVRTEEESVEHLGVRTLLERWGALPNSSRRSDVLGAGLRIKKIVKSGNKRNEIIKRLRRHAHDFLVIGIQSNSHSSFGNLFGRDLAEYLADYFRHNTLFVPSDAKPFVDENTGAVSLQKIVIPVENAICFNLAISVLKKLLTFFPEVDPEIIGLHCGTSFPQIDSTYTDGIKWKTVLSSQPILPAIFDCLQQYSADLIVMPTNGRDTFPQRIIGSNTEQVLRNSPCPLLSVSMI